MRLKLAQLQAIVQADPAIASVKGYTGSGSGTNTGSVYIDLKPKSQRSDTADEVIARLRRKLTQVPGARLYLQSVQDIRIGRAGEQCRIPIHLAGREHERALCLRATPRRGLAKQLRARGCQFRPAANRLGDGYRHRSRHRFPSRPCRKPDRQYALRRVRAAPSLDHLQRGQPISRGDGSRPALLARSFDPERSLCQHVGRESARHRDHQCRGGDGDAKPRPARTGAIERISSSAAANAEGAAARNAQTNALANTGKQGTSAGSPVSTTQETIVPLAAVSHFEPGHTPLAVNHQGLFVASTISYNLAPGASLGDATAEIEAAMKALHAPATIHGSLQGTARLFEESLANEFVLIVAALAAVYIVLGILYESFIHPITILSTLFSAGVGAVLALMLFHTEFSIIAMIGVILLIGIVKKNAILMIDFALEAERTDGLSPRDAIFRACMLRFRPIMMTTFAAIFGAVPLMLSFGEGAEIRRPLGIAIVGGLIVSQLLTLYTTPVLYLYLDRFRHLVERALAPPVSTVCGRSPGTF